MAETNGQRNGTAAPRSEGGLRAFAHTVSRAILGNLFGGKRNLPEIFGYEPSLTYQHFKAAYERQDIANRIVRFFPDKTWAHAPMVNELPHAENRTTFETAWDDLVKRLKIYEVLQRADVLACLGHYSVILLGVRGQKDFALPLVRVTSSDALVYLKAYSEEFVTIGDFEEDGDLPTFGQPRFYNFQFGKRGKNGRVHASRVLHIAEQLLDDEVYSLPRLYPVYDRLVDLLKVVGGSAEMYYRDAKRRIALELREGYTLSAEDEAILTTEAEEYQHGLRDFLRLVGVEAKNLSGTVASPRDHFDIIMDTIAAGSDIPKRQILGSELGELSSSQDERRIAEQIQGRQEKFAGPQMVEALLEKFIAMGALPQPAQGYEIVWPNIWALPETAQATLIKDYATALAQAVTAGEYTVAGGIARVMLAAMGFDPDKPPEPVEPELEEEPLAPAEEEI